MDYLGITFYVIHTGDAEVTIFVGDSLKFCSRFDRSWCVDDVTQNVNIYAYERYRCFSNYLCRSDWSIFPQMTCRPPNSHTHAVKLGNLIK